MFKWLFRTKVVTIHLSDIIFVIAYFFLTWLIYYYMPFNEDLRNILLIPLYILFLAYFWKFWITSVKKDETQPPDKKSYEA